MIRFQSSERFLLAAIISLAFVLFAARWAAREFPLGDRYAWRSGIWLDDRYLLVSQHSKSNQRWRASTKAKHFLVDCERNIWTDLGQELGFDDFSPFVAFATVDGCFFLPRDYIHADSRVRHGIKLDPRTMDWEEIRPEYSLSYNVVGNQYLLSTEDGRFRCFNLVDKSTTKTLDQLSRNEGIRPIPGEASFLAEYRYSSTDPGTVGMGMMGEFDEKHVPDELNQPVFAEEFEESEEQIPPTVEDLEIQAEAKRQGIPPTEIVLRVLYNVVDNRPSEVKRWLSRETSNSPVMSKGLVVESNCNLTDVEVRSGKTGELLRSLAAPLVSRTPDSILFSFSLGTVLFKDSFHNTISAIDVRTGASLPIDQQTTSLIARKDDYLVAHIRSPWATQVQKLPTGNIVINDLTPWEWLNSLDFTSDGRSLKFLTGSDSVVFLDIESGVGRVLKPRAMRVWLCYLAWAVLAGWFLFWIVGCHRLQLPILIQSIVTGTIILLVGYWRLTLADTETFRERPAFIAMMGIAVWTGYRAFSWINARPIPLLAKIFSVQVLVYVWFYYVYLPKTKESYFPDRFEFEAIAIFVAALALLSLKPTVDFIYRWYTNQKQELFRFTITNIVSVTAICAVLVHQIQLIDWQPIVQFGWKGFFNGSVPKWTIAVMLAVVAGWLARRVVKYPKTSSLVFLAVTGILLSWNTIAGLTFPLYLENYELFVSIGYLIQTPLLFAGTIILTGLNARSPATTAVRKHSSFNESAS